MDALKLIKEDYKSGFADFDHEGLAELNLMLALRTQLQSNPEIEDDSAIDAGLAVTGFIKEIGGGKYTDTSLIASTLNDRMEQEGMGDHESFTPEELDTLIRTANKIEFSSAYKSLISRGEDMHDADYSGFNEVEPNHYMELLDKLHARGYGEESLYNANVDKVDNVLLINVQYKPIDEDTASMLGINAQEYSARVLSSMQSLSEAELNRYINWFEEDGSHNPLSRSPKMPEFWFEVLEHKMNTALTQVMLLEGLSDNGRDVAREILYSGSEIETLMQKAQEVKEGFPGRYKALLVSHINDDLDKMATEMNSRNAKEITKDIEACKSFNHYSDMAGWETPIRNARIRHDIGIPVNGASIPEDIDIIGYGRIEGLPEREYKDMASNLEEIGITTMAQAEEAGINIELYQNLKDRVDILRQTKYSEGYDRGGVLWLSKIENDELVGGNIEACAGAPPYDMPSSKN